MHLWSVAIIVFILNIPFGYWRANVRKFSLQWILSVHVPVPFVIALRIFNGLGWHFITFPVLIGSYFAGQFLGGKLHSLALKRSPSVVSSCLIWDVVRGSRRSIIRK